MVSLGLFQHGGEKLSLPVQYVHAGGGKLEGVQEKSLIVSHFLEEQ